MTSLALPENARASLAVRGNDLYESPPVAVHALVAAERLPPVIWEPACGPGAIVRVLRGHGHRVVASDLVDYASPDQDFSGWDFLFERKAPDGVEAIVTNPPFKLAARFAQHALGLCPRVYLLLRLAFLEAGTTKDEAGRARLAVLDGGQLARVLVFRNRLPMMHRDGWDGNKAGPRTAYAWFVWEAGHQGPAELTRISWEALEAWRAERATGTEKDPEALP